MDRWRFVERVTVRNLRGSFIAEARNGARWAVGEVKASPADAMESAAAALILQLAPFIERATKTSAPETDDWEDLL